MKAFVLINIHAGEIREVVQQLKKVEGVKDAYMTFGPYDAVAIVESEDINKLGRILATAIQPIHGVSETLTCLAVEA